MAAILQQLAHGTRNGVIESELCTTECERTRAARNCPPPSVHQNNTVELKHVRSEKRKGCDASERVVERRVNIAESCSTFSTAESSRRYHWPSVRR